MGEDNAVSKFGSENISQEMRRKYPGLEAEIERLDAEIRERLDAIINESTQKFCVAIEKHRKLKTGDWAIFHMWVVSIIRKHGVDCFAKAINETITVLKEVGE